MKIVGFNTKEGLRLGVVEGEVGDRPAGGRQETYRAILANGSGATMAI